KVQLAHAADDRLAGLLIGRDFEARVFGGQALQAYGQFLLILAGLRLDGLSDDRRREFERLKDDRARLFADRVAGRHLLQAGDGNDFARRRRLDVFALVGVHAHDAPDALLRAARRVQRVRARLERAGVDAHERQLADVLVRHDLEDEPRERVFSVGPALFFLARLRVGADHGRNVERAGEVVDDGVEQRLHAFVLKGRTGDHRHEFERDGFAAQRGANLVLADLFAAQVLLGDLVV